MMSSSRAPSRAAASRRRSRCVAGADHRHQRHDARAAGHEQQRAALRRLPDEVAADRAAQLDLVARPQLVGQVRRDLAVVEALDGELDAGAVGRRGDRVAALRLVAVLGGQPDVDVLPGAVTGPVGHVEDERLGAGRLGDDVDDVATCQLSRRSTAAPAMGRRSCGSRRLPEPGLVLSMSRSPRTHFALFQK